MVWENCPCQNRGRGSQSQEGGVLLLESPGAVLWMGRAGPESAHTRVHAGEKEQASQNFEKCQV